MSEDDLANLPEYVSEMTHEECIETRKLVRRQLDSLYKEDCMARINILCGCGRRAIWWMMFRCLYCGVFFCKTCAQIHFGKRLPKEENDD